MLTNNKRNLERRTRGGMEDKSYNRSNHSARNAQSSSNKFAMLLLRALMIWTSRSRCCQKATQRVRKMKPSGMHMQAYVYMEVCHEHRHTQTCNEALSKVNVGKTSCTSLDFGFMRLLRQEDNPNKKILIDIS